jgi:hypothetical protein
MITESRQHYLDRHAAVQRESEPGSARTRSAPRVSEFVLTRYASLCSRKSLNQLGCGSLRGITNDKRRCNHPFSFCGQLAYRTRSFRQRPAGPALWFGIRI